MSLTARLIALALAVAAAIAGWHWITARYDRQGYERRRAEDVAAMQEQADRNRELQRAAELRYTVQTGVRDRFITETITEVRYVTANLAACRLDPAAVGLLNHAAQCASGDTAAACGPGEPVRDAGPADRGVHGAGPGPVDYRLAGRLRLRASQAAGADRGLAAVSAPQLNNASPR